MNEREKGRKGDGEMGKWGDSALRPPHSAFHIPHSYLVSVAEMQELERRADATGHSFASMMELAGRSVAEVILQRYYSTENSVKQWDSGTVAQPASPTITLSPRHPVTMSPCHPYRSRS